MHMLDMKSWDELENKPNQPSPPRSLATSIDWVWCLSFRLSCRVAVYISIICFIEHQKGRYQTNTIIPEIAIQKVRELVPCFNSTASPIASALRNRDESLLRLMRVQSFILTEHLNSLCARHYTENEPSISHRPKLSLPAVKLSLPISRKRFVFYSNFLEFQNISADIQTPRLAPSLDDSAQIHIHGCELVKFATIPTSCAGSQSTVVLMMAPVWTPDYLL